MSDGYDLRVTIRFHGDEQLAWAVQAAVDAVLLHEDVYDAVGTYYYVADDGMFVVCADTGPWPLLLNGWGVWREWFDAQIECSVAEVAPDARVSIEWGIPHEGIELPDLVEEPGYRVRTRELADPPADWSELADRLARVLCEMPTGAYLILTTTDRRYAQVGHQPGEMSCEVVSNRCLDPHQHMPAERGATLSAHGWSEPPGNGTENWAKYVDSPVAQQECARLAGDIVRALSTALAVGAPADLRIEAWRDGLSQTFAVDRLGLTRLPTPDGARRLAYALRKKQSEVPGRASRWLHRARIRLGGRRA
ncbi:TY-Chap domain-containing protein [Nocardia sp. NPDC004722]